MLTSPVSLFLFAHQDDEFGVYYLIKREVRLGRRVMCAYLTTGVRPGGCSRRRNHESLAVLRDLGVSVDDILFIGDSLSVSDCEAVHKMDVILTWLRSFLDGVIPTSIFVTAWEGGHPDHDAIHAVTVRIAATKGLLDRVRQFSLYNGWRRPWKLFSVLRPIFNNGPIGSERIPYLDRVRFLRYCLSYPSQRSSWLGLFPFVFIHYVFFGTQATQPVSKDRINERPHSGLLYYERRGFCTWSLMSDRVENIG